MLVKLYSYTWLSIDSLRAIPYFAKALRFLDSPFGLLHLYGFIRLVLRLRRSGLFPRIYHSA